MSRDPLQRREGEQFRVRCTYLVNQQVGSVPNLITFSLNRVSPEITAE